MVATGAFGPPMVATGALGPIRFATGALGPLWPKGEKTIAPKMAIVQTSPAAHFETLFID